MLRASSTSIRVRELEPDPERRARRVAAISAELSLIGIDQGFAARVARSPNYDAERTGRRLADASAGSTTSGYLSSHASSMRHWL
jgi:hypothetical protein